MRLKRLAGKHCPGERLLDNQAGEFIKRQKGLEVSSCPAALLLRQTVLRIRTSLLSGGAQHGSQSRGE